MNQSDWPDDRLYRLLGIESPIIQAPMAGSSTLTMALAVSGAGGLGSLACAVHDPASLHALLTDLTRKRANGTGAFNANFFAHSPPAFEPARDRQWSRRLDRYYEELGVQKPDRLGVGPIRPFDAEICEIALDAGPEIISFHFGLPSPDLVGKLKRAGKLLMSTATTVNEARWLERRGCDVIIAQGYEAGGHRGMFLTDDVDTQLGTLALVPQLADAVGVPIVAAGGIGDGRGIAAAFALGASGAQLGTAFLFTTEAAISPMHLATISGEDASNSAITNVFSGRPARCVTNRVMRDVGPMSEEVATFPLAFTAIGPLRAEAEARGSRDFSACYCGQSALLGRGRSVSAGALTGQLVADARRVLGKMSS